MIAIMFSEVWNALIANRLRSLLTVLGMVIGVAAVILMLAIGEGARDSISRMISSMGSNIIIVLSGSATSSGGIRMGAGAQPTLTNADAAAITSLSSVVNASPFVSGVAQIVYGQNNWSTSVNGVTPSFFALQNWQVENGSLFTDPDVRSSLRVALIGQTAANKLFDDIDPVGKIVRIQSNPYLIVGLLAKRGQSLDGRDQDDVLFVPVTTAQHKLFGTRFFGSVRLIIVQAISMAGLEDAMTEITDLLRDRHHIAQNMENDFSVQNLTALVNTAVKTTEIMSLLLGAIASISLVVGGIGIMNIMLVSVTERTREIGIRAALGARRKDILLQFLLEALILCCIGCVIGVLLGVTCAYLAYKIFDLNIVVSLKSIFLTFAIAGSIGIFFGYYPARKAAYLKPIDALRYS